MKTYKRYSVGFKEQALVKVYSRSNNQTIESIANELTQGSIIFKGSSEDWCYLSRK